MLLQVVQEVLVGSDFRLFDLFGFPVSLVAVVMFSCAKEAPTKGHADVNIDNTMADVTTNKVLIFIENHTYPRAIKFFLLDIVDFPSHEIWLLQNSSG